MMSFVRRSTCARTLLWLLAGALLTVPSGERLLLCIEADGRIHLEGVGGSAAGPDAGICCERTLSSASRLGDAGAWAAPRESVLGAPSGEQCGPCRDVVASSVPGRAANLRSAITPALHLPAASTHLDLSRESTDFGPFPLSTCPSSSPTLASLKTIVIRC
jgi:hypothetical protein